MTSIHCHCDVPLFRFISRLLAAAACLLPLTAHALTIAAANSTCDVMEKIGALYAQTHKVKIEYICKASGLLAKGLEGKSIQADIFLSASEEWMDEMVQKGQMAKATVTQLWGSDIVIAVPKHSQLSISRLEDITGASVRRIMTGDPSITPLGRHVKDMLERTGLWPQVRDKFETRRHVALLAESLAEADEATVGFIFRTNLGTELRAIFKLDPSLHAPVRYLIGRLEGAVEWQQAESFLAFIRSEEARRIAEEAGYSLLPEQREMSGHGQ